MLGHCLKKRGRGLDRSIILDPLVDPGNPPHRHEACPAADPARPYPRMVVLAQGPSGQRARGSSQAKIATVMLALLGRALGEAHWAFRPIRHADIGTSQAHDAALRGCLLSSRR